MSVRCLSANGFVPRINFRYLCVTSKLSNFDEQKRQQMRASLQAGFFSIFLNLKSRDLIKQILNESEKKFERKRRILESQRLKEKQKEEKIELGKAYKSVTERSLYSLLFSNKLDYEVNLIVNGLKFRKNF